MSASKPPPRNPAPAVSPAPRETPAVATSAVAASPSKSPRERILASIFTVIDHPSTSSAARGLISEYPRFLGVTLNYPDFPVTWHPHPTHKDNCDRPFVTVFDGIVHHIAGAIVAYQMFTVKSRSTINLTEDYKLKIMLAEETMERRIAHLEKVVARYPAYSYRGDVAQGYYLAGE